MQQKCYVNDVHDCNWCDLYVGVTRPIYIQGTLGTEEYCIIIRRHYSEGSFFDALLVNGNGDAPNCRAVTAAVLLWLLGRGAIGVSHSRDLLTSKN